MYIPPTLIISLLVALILLSLYFIYSYFKHIVYFIKILPRIVIPIGIYYFLFWHGPMNACIAEETDWWLGPLVIHGFVVLFAWIIWSFRDFCVDNND